MVSRTGYGTIAAPLLTVCGLPMMEPNDERAPCALLLSIACNSQRDDEHEGLSAHNMSSIPCHHIW